MSGVQLADRTLRSVALIDDSPEAREGYAYAVQDASLDPVDEVGPLPPLDEYASALVGRVDAALCDYKITVLDYSSFSGAQLGALCSKRGFPLVLCTNWERAQLDVIRHFRRWIPVLIRPQELDPDVLMHALERTILELEHGPPEERRPWRVLVRVEDVDRDAHRAYVKLPGWHTEEIMALSLHELPPDVEAAMAAGSRLHAEVNLGADDPDEVFFSEWEAE